MYDRPFRWWVQSVMPLVFDDSLSYYEVLAKLTKYIEGLTGDVKQIEKILATIEGIEDVTKFTEMLENIQNEIGNLSNLSTQTKTNLVSAINEIALKADIAYFKPPTGIPESDLSPEVRDKLNKTASPTEFIINNNKLKPAPSNNTPAKLGLGTYTVPTGGIPWDTLSDDVKNRINEGGSGGGTTDYVELNNKPQINGHTLNAGNNTLETLGIGTYSKPILGIPESDLSPEVQEKLNTSGGIADNQQSFVASRDYEAGELVYINGVLYRTKYKILAGTNMIPGNNIETTDISAELEKINNDIDSLQSGAGPDSWNLTGTVQSYSHLEIVDFFEYFNCIGGENYNFIVDPVDPANAVPYFLDICKRDGTVVLSQHVTEAVDYANRKRFTFVPTDSGEYYCKFYRSASGYSTTISPVKVTIEYTQSQGISELWNQVNKATQLEPQVNSAVALVEQQQKDVDNLYDAYNNNLIEVATWNPDVQKGSYWKVSDGTIGNSSLYARTGKWNCHDNSVNGVSAIQMDNFNYEYCVALYDESGNTYLGYKGYTTGLTAIPKNTAKFALSFRRTDGEAVTDSDVIAIKNSLKSLRSTDPTLTVAGASADSKVVGERFDAVGDRFTGIDELMSSDKEKSDYITKTVYKDTFNSVPFLAGGGYARGSININTGATTASTTNARRSNTFLSGNYVTLGTDAYEYNLFYYNGVGSSWADTYAHVYSGWIKGSELTLVYNKVGDRVKMVIKRADGEVITDEDLALFNTIVTAYNINQEIPQITTKRNNPTYIAQLKELAEEWYEHRNDIVLGSKAMIYGNTSILNTSSYTRQIDCSTFVGMLLRGYGFLDTPYATGIGANPNSWIANSEYNWAINPFDYVNYSRNNSSSRTAVRYASQLAEMMIQSGRTVPIDRYYANIEPGDVLFFSRHDQETEDWYEPLRFKHINHVALCITKEKATTADGWDTATYPWKHTFIEVGHEDAENPDGVIKIKFLELPQNDASDIYENNINTLCLVCRPDLGSI